LAKATATICAFSFSVESFAAASRQTHALFILFGRFFGNSVWENGKDRFASRGRQGQAKLSDRNNCQNLLDSHRGDIAMKRMQLSLCVALLLFVVLTGWIMAQEQPGAKAARAPASAPAANIAPARPADEQAIKASSQAFAKAFESGDARAVAALFTDEAEYIDEDAEPVRGKAALARAYEDFFAKRKEVRAESKTDAVRFLGTDTAVEEGTFTVNAKDSPPSSSRFSALHVRQGGKWLIALLKEWSDETTSKPSLQDLAWLIGTWESDGGDLSARTTYEWAANKSFIKAQYTITPKKAGEQASSGTQVIGVDPAVSQIRAWLFASDGGIGESTWGWDGTRWMIESAGTLPDGSHTQAINIMTRTGDDAFTWRSVSRNLGGEPQPDIAPVTVRRMSATSAASRQPGR
jgi:uncharacterized protein (TIGR02246 family)